MGHWHATPPHLLKYDLPTLSWISPVMLADNQAQAFSVASPTAICSAVLRTCDRQGLKSQ
jgi:hypothetical protein